MERTSTSSCQSISFSATRAGGIIVRDQTTYPRVAGKPACSVISMNAPQTPQKMVVTSAKMSQSFDFIGSLPQLVQVQVQFQVQISNATFRGQCNNETKTLQLKKKGSGKYRGDDRARF